MQFADNVLTWKWRFYCHFSLFWERWRVATAYYKLQWLSLHSHSSSLSPFSKGCTLKAKGGGEENSSMFLWPRVKQCYDYKMPMPFSVLFTINKKRKKGGGSHKRWEQHSTLEAKSSMVKKERPISSKDEHLSYNERVQIPKAIMLEKYNTNKTLTWKVIKKKKNF